MSSPSRPEEGRWLRPAVLPYALTTFLSAFLLFQVQLVISKYILPWFGGTPAVWTTSMLFFEIVLLAGYAYAHWLGEHSRHRLQGLFHLLLLAASLLILAATARRWGVPLLPDAGWKPGGSEEPVLAIAALLAAGVGAPFFVLSSTAPLLQRWAERSGDLRSPYPLYALSNAGSLLGLLSYPFLVERALTLRAQAWTWASGYLCFVLACGACSLRAAAAPAQASSAGQETTRAAHPATPAGAGLKLLWVTLPACASMMLLATTNLICQQIAVVPFLWVLPLALYLLSFILCFQSDACYARRPFLIGLGASVAAAVGVLFWGPDSGILVQIVVFSLTLFFCCMICHGELARLKPSPRFLTSFYLLVALGGALGGASVALIAPRLFRGFWEFHLGLLGAVVLALVALQRDPGSWLRSHPRPRLVLLSAVLACAALALLLLAEIGMESRRSVALFRNFYGVLAVDERSPDDPQWHSFALAHGRITHGIQFAAEPLRHRPTAYYGSSSGLGLALLNRRRAARTPEEQHLRIGGLGLGIGSIAAYARAGDSLRFYEINPEVVRLAQSSPYFNYLKDCPGRVEVVLGDARVSLQRELDRSGSQQFDFLVVDVFTGDAPPVHLFTQEALELYWKHLKLDGVLLLHISNKALDFRPVLLELANRLGLETVYVISPGAPPVTLDSEWVMMARHRQDFRIPLVRGGIGPIERGPRTAGLWTDNYSNLFRVLKW